MTDEAQIVHLYKEMYAAMIAKDRAVLERVHSDRFVLTHMTGMRQPKAAYIDAIADGTLNYYAAQHEDMQVTVSGGSAVLTGKSRVTAAVFGGGRHTWRLMLKFELEKVNGAWYFTSARAAAY